MGRARVIERISLRFLITNGNPDQIFFTQELLKVAHINP
jgi:hypothetical protein